jgi:hypothetical protein
VQTQELTNSSNTLWQATASKADSNSVVTVVQTNSAGVAVTNQFTIGDANPTIVLPTISAAGRTLLASYVVSDAVASVTFSNIPASYRNLEIEAYQRTDENSAGNLCYLQFNGDTNANYGSIRNNLAGVSWAGANTSYSAVRAIYGSTQGGTASASWFTFLKLTIPEYTNTVFKKSGYTVGAQNGGIATGKPSIDIASFAWDSTNIITAIKFIPGGGNWTNNSAFYLYGVP